ncbi:restriction endonuclease [Micromonospora sp. URMC 106]|uniref:restriction endonuclease n=1 Tax=Micromonospora sp. URMC 106 TaxID=3423408 RepID=UPI003F1E37C5
MPYVRSHVRRNGARVRAHYRRRRPARGARPARRGRSGSHSGNGWVLALGGAAVVAVALIVEFVEQHPYWSALSAVVAVGVATVLLSVRARQVARRRAEQAERDRAVAVTDAMTGAEFEQWVARLLEASGFQHVRVRGGAGDRGADVTAIAPDGRRAVVQCKRQSPTNRVGSAAIQRFAGTCRQVHGGELCMIVTNGFFTAGDGVRLARQLGIVLVDRRVLETWAWTRTPPPILGG